MSGFTVEVYDTSDDPISMPDRLQLTPQWYSSIAVGGYESADIRVDGPSDAIRNTLQWLGYTVRIYNQNHSLVWTGIVDEALITAGAMQFGLSIREIANRIKVAYTQATADGTLERLTTAWAEDTESVTRYGYSEQLRTNADVSTAQAESYRGTLLATLKNPTPLIRTLRGASAPSATLSCSGQWSLLSRQLYSQVAGLLEHNVAGGADQLLGVGQTSTNIGFSDIKLADLGNKLDALPSGVSVVISGSTSNDGTIVTIGSGNDGEAYTATTISFDPSDDILDLTGEGLAFLNDNDIITIAGAATASHNSTRFVTDAINNEHITVSIPPNIVTEAAGNSVTITQAGWIDTDTTFVNELPSASVTMTAHGVMVAQKFTLAANVTWTVNDVAIRVRKVGSPADNVKVALYSDSSGSPGSETESATVAASSIGTSMAWYKFTFGNTNSIAYGADYWIVVSRTGANSMDDYYIVDIDEDLGYTSGDLKLYTGSSWVARDPDGDMPFIIRGAEETTAQISDIINDSAQFITAYDLQDESNVESNQYRAGDGDALYEIKKLLDAGTSSAARLLARVNSDKILTVYQQPTSDISTDLVMQGDGTLTQANGVVVERGVLPTGKWVRIHGIATNVDHLAPLSKFFIERSEYHVDSGEWVLEPPGTESVWNTGINLQ